MSPTTTRIVQTAASNGLRLALSAATTVLIARTLQPEGRGVYAMIVTTATTAIVAGHLSVGKSQIALWPDPTRHRSLTGNGLLLGLLFGTVSALFTLGVVITFVPGLTPHPLGIALLAVPFGIASSNLNGIALLQFRTALANRGVILSALVLSLPVVVLAVTGNLTVTSAVVCWAMATTAPVALFLRSLGPAVLRGDATLARRQLSLSGRYHIGLICHHLLQTADVFLLNIFVSEAEVGLYAAAGALLALAWVPTDAIAQVTVYRQAGEDEGTARDVTARALRFNLLLCSAVTAVLAIASPTLIPLLYGDAYTGSVAPLLLLAPGAIALSLTRPTDQYLVRLGRPLSMAVLPLGALALNLALNVLLIPRWGAAGAALASSLGYTALAATAVGWFAWVAGVGVRELLPRADDVRWVISLLPRRPGPAARSATGGTGPEDGIPSGPRGRGEDVLVAAKAAPARLQKAQLEPTDMEE
ncbi:lipopolysaccharide biosynthesis protein [Streptosporangium sp. NPDC004631]